MSDTIRLVQFETSLCSLMKDADHSDDDDAISVP